MTKWYCWLKEDSKIEWEQFLQHDNLEKLQSLFPAYQPASVQVLERQRDLTDPTLLPSNPGPSTQYVLDRFCEEDQLPRVSIPI